jgi:hypothetical protein
MVRFELYLPDRSELVGLRNMVTKCVKTAEFLQNGFGVSQIVVKASRLKKSLAGCGSNLESLVKVRFYLKIRRKYRRNFRTGEVPQLEPQNEVGVIEHFQS